MKKTLAIAVVAVAGFGLQTPPVAHADDHDYVAHAVNFVETEICQARMSGERWPDVVDSIAGRGRIYGKRVETGLDETTALAVIKASIQTLCPQMIDSSSP